MSLGPSAAKASDEDATQARMGVERDVGPDTAVKAMLERRQRFVPPGPVGRDA